MSSAVASKQLIRVGHSPDPDDAFMFTALGRDDTGGILWGPWTLDAAREQGVHLTEDYRIIDENNLQYQNACSVLRPCPRYHEVDLKQLMPSFRVYNSYLLRNGMKEYLFVGD